MRSAASVASPKTYKEYIQIYFKPEDWKTAEAVCMAESHCQSKVSPPNFNGTRDYGVFQVNSIHAGKVGGDLNLLLDPETNVRVAAQIKNGSGWHAWATYNNGRYLKYLN